MSAMGRKRTLADWSLPLALRPFFQLDWMLVYVPCLESGLPACCRIKTAGRQGARWGPPRDRWRVGLPRPRRALVAICNGARFQSTAGGTASESACPHWVRYGQPPKGNSSLFLLQSC